MNLRLTQKTTYRKAVIATSVLVLAAGVFLYINFSRNEESKASTLTTYKPTYQTTDEVVPVRLLLSRSKGDLQLSNNKTSKIDTSIVERRKGRSMIIPEGRYMTD